MKIFLVLCGAMFLIFAGIPDDSWHGYHKRLYDTINEDIKKRPTCQNSAAEMQIKDLEMMRLSMIKELVDNRNPIFDDRNLKYWKRVRDDADMIGAKIMSIQFIECDKSQ